MSTRIERDSLGEVEIPDAALHGAQTQRAVNNFQISGRRMPRAFIGALGTIKAAAAAVNHELGLLDGDVAAAIEAAARQVESGQLDQHFPIDVFQSGSGTSTNMNANEVIATLASRELGRVVHPNDDVNRGQSSNDVIPTALSISAALALANGLLPALAHLEATVQRRAAELEEVVKIGRTHLMDAMPLSFGQELGGWAAQIAADRARLAAILPDLLAVALGGTAVGTGINAHPEFADRVCQRIARASGLHFRPSTNYFRALSSLDTPAALSGALRGAALTLLKISNDLRWMNSGPDGGLGEITLPQLQPGSSIMPGKVNPVIPEAVAMVAARVVGNDATIAMAAGAGNFQLNVMQTVVAHDLLDSLTLLSAAARHLADLAIANFVVRKERVAAAIEKNAMLVTALTSIIGYDLAAAIARRAQAESRPIKEVAAEMTDLSRERLDVILDPIRLTRGGLPSAPGNQAKP